MVDVYHAGEIAVQERAGERSIAARRGSMVSPRLVDGARAFLARRGTAALAVAAPDGSVWASLWCGASGFLSSDESGVQVELDRSLTSITSHDVIAPLIRVGDPLGLLVIDFATRRRLRINGAVTRMDASGIAVSVRESFGNCIKYIQRRERRDTDRAGVEGSVIVGESLDVDRLDFVRRTDTLLVGSTHPERGLDVSHRGGEPGFVQVLDGRTLRIPDYPGNSMYQTLGNLEVDARAGLALVDFEARRILSLTGRAAITFGAENRHHPTGGTGRYWTFAVEQWVEFSMPARIQWTLVDRSPFNPPAHTCTNEY
jgi:predicted pyridoxine 5'-phosphate oxidase superfamily flavin-nucleotide-binding protein